MASDCPQPPTIPTSFSGSVTHASVFPAPPVPQSWVFVLAFTSSIKNTDDVGFTGRLEISHHSGSISTNFLFLSHYPSFLPETSEEQTPITMCWSTVHTPRCLLFYLKYSAGRFYTHILPSLKCILVKFFLYPIDFYIYVYISIYIYISFIFGEC